MKFRPAPSARPAPPASEQADKDHDGPKVTADHYKPTVNTRRSTTDFDIKLPFTIGVLAVVICFLWSPLAYPRPVTAVTAPSAALTLSLTDNVEVFNPAHDNDGEIPKTQDSVKSADPVEQSHWDMKADDHGEGAERKIQQESVLWTLRGTEDEAKSYHQRVVRLLRETDEINQQSILHVLREAGYKPEPRVPDTVVDRPECEYQTLRVV